MSKLFADQLLFDLKGLQVRMIPIKVN